MDEFTTYYDIYKHELITHCTLNPTDVTQEQVCWLFVRNNKYHPEEVDYSKVGKWMLFVSAEQVNEVWEKIKDASKQGTLWDSKVSTVNPSSPNHAIMVYTKDYSDIDDVINVLEFLEESGIKSPNTVLYYKTDQQTRAGIYSGGRRKASTYSSKTVRDVKTQQKSMDGFSNKQK